MFPDLTRDDVFRIETRRLWLRWPRFQDAHRIVQIAANTEVAEMVGVLAIPFPANGGETYVFEGRKGNAVGTQLRLVIAEKRRPDHFIGIIGSRWLSAPDEAKARVSLGFWLDPAQWGNGLATEAAQALIDAIFAFTDADEIESMVRVINPASRRVLEKCGFQNVGPDMWDAPALRSRVPVDRFVLARSTFRSLKGWRDPRFEGREASDPVATDRSGRRGTPQQMAALA
jgi:RimJ/RimL family protein N-acetyltransferase